MNISSDQYHNGLGLFRQALNDPSLELEWIWKPRHQKLLSIVTNSKVFINVSYYQN